VVEPIKVQNNIRPPIVVEPTCKYWNISVDSAVFIENYFGWFCSFYWTTISDKRFLDSGIIYTYLRISKYCSA
jgi:hypothetical protein